MKTDLPPAADIRAAFTHVRRYHDAFILSHNLVRDMLGEEFGVVGALEHAALVLSEDARMLSLRDETGKHVLYVAEKVELDGLTLYISPGYEGERQIAYVAEPILGAQVLIDQRDKAWEIDSAKYTRATFSADDLSRYLHDE